jgi:hypothetical protein
MKNFKEFYFAKWRMSLGKNGWFGHKLKTHGLEWTWFLVVFDWICYADMSSTIWSEWAFMALLNVQPTIMKTSPSFLNNNNQNINCQGHENYKKKMTKDRPKSKSKKHNKKFKMKTPRWKSRTRNVQNQGEDKFYYGKIWNCEHEKTKIRLCFKFIP